MLEAEYLIFCRQVQIESNGISLIRTSDTIPASRFPLLVTDAITAVAKIRAKKSLAGSDIPYRLEIEYDNSLIWGTKGQYPGRPVPKYGVMFFHVDMEGLRFDKAGWYYVNLYMDDKKLITRTLHIDTPEKMKEIYINQEIIQSN